MPFSHGSKARVYANGYDLTTFLTDVKATRAADTAEATTLGKTSKVRVPGLTDGGLSGEGLFDGVVDAVDQVLSAALGASAGSIWTYLPAGDGLGQTGHGLAAHQTGYDLDAPADGLVALSVEAESTVGRERLTVLHALASETGPATVNGASVDNTTATTAGGAVYLQATTAGAQSVTVKAQHSVDASVWVDLVTMTAVAAAGRVAERKEVSGTINRHTRCQAIPGGAGATPPFHLAIRRA